MGIEFVKIDHCSVIITDVAKSRAFYSDILGLQEINKPKTFDFVVVWYDLGDQHLHLLLKDQPDTHSPRHFALRVTDTKAAREHFHKHGIETKETTVIPDADRFFVNDPDGNRIEIIQWTAPYDPVNNGVPGGQ